jgi:SAM-dependent methyltransferase
MYDAHWGATTAPLHRHMVERFLDLCPAPARILDAACGTGKYWPLLLGRARTVVGIDQSWGMLQRARAKFPAVPIRKLGLQELAEVDAFEGIACIDAMELVCAEDWPRVLANFHRALIPGGVLYLTVELPQPDLADVFRAAVDAGLPVIAGEYVKGGGYHYSPGLNRSRSGSRRPASSSLRKLRRTSTTTCWPVSRAAEGGDRDGDACAGLAV